ncbi:MAG: hypothetical protein AAEJ52_22445, partial [Myxococcota bacterium]
VTVSAGLLAAPATSVPLSEPLPGATTQQADDWRGRYCTATSCAGAPSRPGSAALGFGSAVLAAGWIARRRQQLEI